MSQKCIFKDTSKCTLQNLDLYYIESSPHIKRKIASLEIESKEKSLKNVPDYITKYEKTGTQQVKIFTIFFKYMKIVKIFSQKIRNQ